MSGMSNHSSYLADLIEMISEKYHSLNEREKDPKGAKADCKIVYNYLMRTSQDQIAKDLTPAQLATLQGRVEKLMGNPHVADLDRKMFNDRKRFEGDHVLFNDLSTCIEKIENVRSTMGGSTHTSSAEVATATTPATLKIRTVAARNEEALRQITVIINEMRETLPKRYARVDGPYSVDEVYHILHASKTLDKSFINDENKAEASFAISGPGGHKTIIEFTVDERGNVTRVDRYNT